MYRQCISIVFLVLVCLLPSTSEAKDGALQGHITHKETISGESPYVGIPEKSTGDRIPEIGDSFNHLGAFETELSNEDNAHDQIKNFDTRVIQIDNFYVFKMDQPRCDRVEKQPAPRHKPPKWMRGRVYTNDKMTMYTFTNYFFFKKEFKYTIPSDRPSTLKIYPEIVVYWNGYRPRNCYVTCVPYGPRGNFRFYHRRDDGPHGYLEYIGPDKDGFANYRYWFSQ